MNTPQEKAKTEMQIVKSCSKSIIVELLMWELDLLLDIAVRETKKETEAVYKKAVENMIVQYQEEWETKKETPMGLALMFEKHLKEAKR